MVNVISFYNTKFKMEGDSLVESVNLLLKQLCHKSDHSHLKSPLSPTDSFSACIQSFMQAKLFFKAGSFCCHETGDMKCLLGQLSILTSVLIRL